MLTVRDYQWVFEGLGDDMTACKPPAHAALERSSCSPWQPRAARLLCHDVGSPAVRAFAAGPDLDDPMRCQSCLERIYNLNRRRNP